jgi:hypothetical protein
MSSDLFDLIENEEDNELLIEKLNEIIGQDKKMFRYHRRKFVKIYVKDFGFVETNVNVNIIEYAKILGKVNTYNFLKNLKRNLRGIIVTSERSRSRRRNL